MYWFSVPAVLKEWIDKVLTKGFAYTDEKSFSKGLFSVRLSLKLCFWVLLLYWRPLLCRIKKPCSPLPLALKHQCSLRKNQMKTSITPCVQYWYCIVSIKKMTPCLIFLVTLNLAQQQGTLTYCGFKILEPQIFWAPACVSKEACEKMLATWEERLKNIANEKTAEPLKHDSCKKTSESGASHQSPEDRKKSGVWAKMWPCVCVLVEAIKANHSWLCSAVYLVWVLDFCKMALLVGLVDFECVGD